MPDKNLSVFIVSYNQEQYISQTIDSVVNQGARPYEIVISDDCSIDNTWDIIQDYAAKYPTIIKSYRNETNIGIFKNFNKATSLVTGNLITCVAGDDYINPGYFEAVFNFIDKNRLNPETDSFLLIPDIVKLLNGVESTYSNIPFSGKNLKKLSLRGLIDDRYGIMSRPALNNVPAFLENIGIYADLVWNMERYIRTDHMFFIGGYYLVYRIGVGIVSKTKEKDAAISYNKGLEIITQRFKQVYDKSDLRYIEYMKRKNNFIIKRTLKNYILVVYNTFLNIGNYYSIKKQMKAFTFIFLHRKIKNFLFKNNYLKMLSQ